jgi:CO dehydrogenase maturation factor
MRIAFCGKGGSGKTTLAAAFIRYLLRQRQRVIAVDADINQNLSAALGVQTSIARSCPSLSTLSQELKSYLRNENRRIASVTEMLKTTPPGCGSRLIDLSDSSWLYERLARKQDGMALLSTGDFSPEDLGSHCYHSKTGILELLLNHLIDTTNEYVVVDMTAGADTFASGLFAKFDLSILVVEPTQKSISVLTQYQHHAKRFEIAIEVVTNKESGPADIEFFSRHLPCAPLVSVTHSTCLKAFEQGDAAAAQEFDFANQDTMQRIKQRLDLCHRDWDRYLQLSFFFHEKNCLDWANALYGKDLRHQIDRDFKYVCRNVIT